MLQYKYRTFVISTLMDYFVHQIDANRSLVIRISNGDCVFAAVVMFAEFKCMLSPILCRERAIVERTSHTLRAIAALAHEPTLSFATFPIPT